MVFGCGLIGTAFSDLYGQNPKVCLYSAGVSNSQCTESSEFHRDKKTLEQNISNLKKNQLLIYISTCSITTSNSMFSSRYIEHKIEMENLVIKYGHYLVLRFPQLASFSKNPFTLLNYLKNKINSGETFEVLKNGFRNILDVDDAVSISDKLISNFSGPRIMNVANPNSVPVVEIIEEMERVLEKKAIYNFIENLENIYNIDVTEMMEVIDRSQYNFDEKYLGRAIKKYYQFG